MDKKDMMMISKTLMWASVVSVALSAFSYLYVDIWLASSQWLLVAVVLALFGVYLKMDK